MLERRHQLIRRLLALAALLTAVPAAAHLMAPRAGTLNIVGTSAYLVVSVPVSALPGVDDDHDGLLSPAELDKHSRRIGDDFSRRFTVTAEAAPGRPVLTWVVPPQTGEAPAPTPYVVVMQRLVFPQPPQRPEITTDLFGTTSADRQLTITATAKPRSDVAILTTEHPSHRFFGTALENFADFFVIGTRHILGGADHLLFLLTILAAGAGWRYWLMVVTGFTLAHSLTLALAATGTVAIPGAITEAAIAASIIVVALRNLLHPGGGAARVPIVVVCGLLHGLGLASALAGLSPDATHRLASLAGFNLGVEAGQIVFLVLVLLLAALLRRLGIAPPMLVRAGSLLALAGGAVMLIARLG